MEIARFYNHDPNAPKPTQPTHLGVNVFIEYDGKLLLEKRRDCNTWGLVGGGVKKREEERKAISREVWEETGLYIHPSRFQKVKVYGNPDRIAAYRDGSIWRMVIIQYKAVLEEEPKLRVSAESKDLRWFTRDELRDTHIIVTHRDIVEDFYGPTKAEP